MNNTTTTNTTKVFLNTWGAYNNGSIGYGWFEPAEAIDFMDENPERDGGEWFIADIDNYLGVDFGNLEYCNVEDVCNTIIELLDMDEWERDEVIAVMEYIGCELQEAIDTRDHYTIYSDIDSYYDCMDDLVTMEMNGNSWLENYFDWDAYHRDLMYDACECSNGVVIVY